MLHPLPATFLYHLQHVVRLQSVILPFATRATPSRSMPLRRIPATETAGSARCGRPSARRRHRGRSRLSSFPARHPRWIRRALRGHRQTLPASLRLVAEIRAGASQADSAIETPFRRSHPHHDWRSRPDRSGCRRHGRVHHETRRHSRGPSLRHVRRELRPAGSEARRDHLLLNRGTLLTESAVAVAASVGKTRLQVLPRPSVAVLSTGDEIVDAARRAANQSDSELKYLFPRNADQSRRRRARAACRSLLMNRCACANSLKKGLRSDLLLLAGGVSMGKYDLVEQVLTELWPRNSISPAH